MLLTIVNKYYPWEFVCRVEFGVFCLLLILPVIVVHTTGRWRIAACIAAASIGLLMVRPVVFVLLMEFAPARLAGCFYTPFGLLIVGSVAVVHAAVLVILVVLLRRAAAREAVDSPRCPGCGYDLRTPASDRCPECGLRYRIEQRFVCRRGGKEVSS